MDRTGLTDGDVPQRWSTRFCAVNPDVIVIVGDRVIPILTKLTRSIPIVVALTSDPIASGAVESLARPGRNVTGFSLVEFSIFGKMLAEWSRQVVTCSLAPLDLATLVVSPRAVSAGRTANAACF